MAYVVCAGCGEIVEVPPELGGDADGKIQTDEPYYCDACEVDLEVLEDE